MNFKNYVDEYITESTDLSKSYNIKDFDKVYKFYYKKLIDIYSDDDLDGIKDIEVPVKVVKKDSTTMSKDDNHIMLNYLELLKKKYKNLNFAGEMAVGGKFYTIDTYLNYEL